MIDKFNIRVYGILETEGRVLLLRESYRNKQFIKFPGGGLEFGEGPVDCLCREFKEELDLDLMSWEHFYTTEHYQQSAFRASDQILSIYYKVQPMDLNALRLIDDPTANIRPEQIEWYAPLEKDHDFLSFPIDKIVWNMLKG
jgi:8-oxo-dGTP pyrophosphatase MutT (NUDIX family)